MAKAGFVGLITANSFMKREFGSKLIEQVLPRLDLTHVVDTSSAKIPEHDTPTVILFGRHRAPVGNTVRAVMGIKGEPSTPEDPARGLVWLSIVAQADQPGSESEFVSVGDVPRATFGKHPWSIGGGGAAGLMETIESQHQTLGSVVAEIGITAVTGEDEVYLLADEAHARRLGIEHIRPFVTGTAVRDWGTESSPSVWLYDDQFRLLSLETMPRTAHYFWPAASVLSKRKRFGTPMLERGLSWYEYQELYINKLRTPLSITFAFVSTHNHFVLDRGGRVFNRHAQVVKLPVGSNEDQHLGLLGLLNSSVACFWLQQVCHNKGGPGGGSSKDEKWHDFYEFSSTQTAEFPVVEQRPIALARQIDRLALELSALRPASLMAAAPLPTRTQLDAARDRSLSIRRQMIAWQEELDWHCYALYSVLPAGVAPEDVSHSVPPEVAPGERAFEIALAREMAAGTLETRWFEWLGIVPTVDIPERWPEDYRRVVKRRIALIESDRNIRLLESMGCKRRWETPQWEAQERDALRARLLDRLEASQLWSATENRSPQISTVNRLTDEVRSDPGFIQIATLYAAHADFDLGALVAELVAAESVPFLPVLRYKESGLRKRAQWEETWALQRREGVAEAAGKIPVPPDYKRVDFITADFWRLRGGLDMPKERWISYPGCQRGADASLPIAWAGWNHLQQATALAAYYLEMKENEGWEPARLQPLLAGLLELLPWLEQWHNEIDPVYGERMGTYYRGFVNEEARSLGFTLDDLRGWKPVARASGRGRRRKA